ncbi:hypothetical protein [Streptomyces sp. NPDC002676]
MTSAHAAEITLRGLGACCAVGNTVLHALLVPTHLQEKFYISVLFALGAATMLVVAAALVIAKRPALAWFTGALVSAGMIVGFLLSRTVGLPDGYYERSWEPPYGALSLVVEGMFVLTFLTWLGGRGTATREDRRPPYAAATRESRIKSRERNAGASKIQRRLAIIAQPRQLLAPPPK